MRYGWRSAAIAAGALVALLPGQGRAAQGELPPYFSSGPYRALVGRTLASVPPAIFRRCPGLVSPGSRIVVMKPLSFRADGAPMAGMWRQSFPVSGCGNDTVLNFFFAVQGDGKIETLVAAPGTTRADPVLQHDALRYVTLAIVNKGCRSFVITNTRFEGWSGGKPPAPPPGSRRDMRGWDETWTAAGCSHTFEVPISFGPDATGTVITTRMNKVVEH